MDSRVNRQASNVCKKIPQWGFKKDEPFISTIWAFFEGMRLTQSKGGILSKACDYIRELRQTNQRLQESFKEVERVQVDNELLRQQVQHQ
ncbi:USF2 factor, partial [Polypterus senegalus]